MNALSPRTRALIERARSADKPTKQARDRVANALTMRIAAAAGIAVSGVTVSRSAAGASLAKALSIKALTAVGVTVSAGAIGWQALAPAPVVVSFSEQPFAAQVAKGARVIEAEVAKERQRELTVTAKHDEEIRRGSAPAVEPVVPSGDERRERAAFGVTDGRESGEGVAVPTRRAIEVEASKAAPSARRESPVAVGNFPTQAETHPAPRWTETAERSEGAEPLLAEAEALRRAQQALRGGDGASALRLLEEQETTFASGALGQERAAARVFALCQAGRSEQARSEAVRFEQRWPRSPLLGRVRQACR